MDSQRTCPVDGHVGGDGAGQLVGRHSVERTSDPAHAGFSPGLSGCRVSAVENSSTALEEAPARGRERRKQTGRVSDDNHADTFI